MRWWARVAAFSLALVLSSGCSGLLSSQTPTPSPTAALPTARPTHTPRPTPTLTDVTPAPGAALLTPTPIVYVVESGDTLIAIANKFGVSVADLIAANGNVNPAQLQIGQRLVVPSSARDVSAAASSQGEILPTPTPVPFEVRGLNSARTPAGSVDIVGEVYNPTAFALENVRVLIVLQDESGKPLQEAVAFTALDVVPAGQSAPFRVLVIEPPPNYARFTALPIRGEISARGVGLALQPVDLNARMEDVQFRVTGALVNTSAQPLGALRVVVTAYDEQRRVIGYRYVRLDAQLAPGESVPLDVSLTLLTRPVASFSLYADGLP